MEPGLQGAGRKHKDSDNTSESAAWKEREDTSFLQS